MAAAAFADPVGRRVAAAAMWLADPLARRDAAYSTETFRRTADGIPDSHLIIYPRTTHMGAIKHPRFASDVTAFLAADTPGPR